jgi:NAD(P)-dependent dehydrogenase (short-subunit alcohol dehydrogenase family)
MNKTIFITGASSGIGRASAIHFAERGWNVAATMRTPEKEKQLSTYTNIKVFKLDVTDANQAKQAAQAAIDAFGKIDVVLNNAGMGVYGALELASEADIDWQFAVNVRGVINVTRAFLPHFRAKGGGKFINVSSFMGITTAVPLGSLYNMSKFAMEGLTEGLYYELEPLNISLHLLEPGGMKENRFKENMVWNTSEEIKDYTALSNKVSQLMNSLEGVELTEQSDIANEIYKLASGASNKFRTIIGQTGKDLMSLRNSVPIEEYLEKINSAYR